MGIRDAYAALEAAVEALTPLSDAANTFAAVDSSGAAGALSDAARNGGRPFDIGAASLPIDDGEAGAADANTLRLRASCVLRVAYLNTPGGDRRELEVRIAEDVSLIRSALMTPANWDAGSTGIISVAPPGVPTIITEGDVLIVAIPFDLIYREG